MADSSAAVPLLQVTVSMPLFLNQTELAKYLGVSPRTLEAWRLTRRGPGYFKIGGGVRYPAQLVNEFIATLIEDGRDRVRINAADGGSADARRAVAAMPD